MYGVNSSSDSISRDMNLVLYSSTFKHPADGEFAKIKQLISLDYEETPNHENRSTPGSFFSNLLNENGVVDDDDDDEFAFETHQKKKDARDFQTDLDSTLIGRPTSGFLSSLTNHQNGFAGVKDVRKGTTSLNNTINFSLGPSSTSRFLPQIAENEDTSLKRKMSQLNGEARNHTPNLVHHMSLPKTSSEMAAVDNFLHFQQDSSVPWKTRAKRGFATHPRSIAERVRRTRISERIKRLQELFPDMDKQTNTADMLDMAVEYIKDLQKELQTLNDARARCTCSSKQLQSGSTM